MRKLKPLGPGIIPIALSKMYAAFIFCRNAWYDLIPRAVKKTGHYTLSIGCIHAGGTGKTPLSLLIGTFLQKKGYMVAFLSRGYGRKQKNHVIVKPKEQRSWVEIGDEPALLKKYLPSSWLGIGADRFLNAAKIQTQIGEKSVFILDDGFQHRKIMRNKNIICLPPDPFIDHIIPAGTMREPLSNLKRADIICLIGLIKEADILKKSFNTLSQIFPEKPIFILHHVPDKWVNSATGETTDKIPLKKPILISGIARPKRFMTMVADTGIVPYKCINFADHHIFTKTEINKLYLSEADGFITTEKDNIRLSTINFNNEISIWFLKIKQLFLDTYIEQEFYSCLFEN